MGYRQEVLIRAIFIIAYTHTPYSTTFIKYHGIDGKMVWCSNFTAYRRQEKCLNGLVSGSASWSMCVPIVEPEADGKLSLGHGPCLILLTTTLYQLPIILSKLFLISDFNFNFFLLQRSVMLMNIIECGILLQFRTISYGQDPDI